MHMKHISLFDFLQILSKIYKYQRHYKDEIYHTVKFEHVPTRYNEILPEIIISFKSVIKCK